MITVNTWGAFELQRVFLYPSFRIWDPFPRWDSGRWGLSDAPKAFQLWSVTHLSQRYIIPVLLIRNPKLRFLLPLSAHLLPLGCNASCPGPGKLLMLQGPGDEPPDP